jgi:hypothetical protein
MFSLRHFADATGFLLMCADSSSAHPDFNADEIDVDQPLASLPLPPKLEFLETSDILEVEAPSAALKIDQRSFLPSLRRRQPLASLRPLSTLWCGSGAGTIRQQSAASGRSGSCR